MRAHGFLNWPGPPRNPAAHPAAPGSDWRGLGLDTAGRGDDGRGRMKTPPRFLPALALAMLAAATTPGARATFTFDVQATLLNGSPLTGGNTPKTLFVSPGDVIVIEVFAKITGAPGNPGAEGLQIAVFTMRSSSGGGIAVNFNSPLVLHEPFAIPIVQRGLVQDLDGDGDLDLGSNAIGASPNPDPLLSGANNIVIHAGSMQTSGLPIPDGLAFDLGTASITIGSVLPAAAVTLDALVADYPRALDHRARGLWEEDTFKKDGTSGTFTSGVPLTLTAAPEPGSVALLALGALGWLGRRRLSSAPPR